MLVTDMLPKLALLLLFTNSLFSQDMAFSRRLLNVSTFLNGLENRPDSVGVSKRHGSVLVVFRTSERGAVVYTKAIDGPKDLRDIATESVKKWKFKPTALLSCQPVQMISAAILDFSKDRVMIRPSAPMTAQQLSPEMPSKCLNGLLNGTPDVLPVCQQQLQAIEASDSSGINLLTAEDELAIALLRSGPKASDALRHVSKAIQLAPSAWTEADAEGAYLYWHRAIAERESGLNIDAAKDFLTAEDKFTRAAQQIGNSAAAAYYAGLAATIKKQAQALPPG